MCRFADGIKASPASRRVLASGYVQTRSIVATSSARNQISEPRRLAAESNPSLNGEGSTIRRRSGAMPHSRRVGVKHALPYRVKAWHPQVSNLGLDCREGPLYWYANGGAIDP